MRLPDKGGRIFRRALEMAPPPVEAYPLAFDPEKDVTPEQKQKLFQAVAAELAGANLRRAITYAGRLAMIYPEKRPDLQALISLDDVRAAWKLQLQTDEKYAGGKKIREQPESYPSGTFDLWFLHDAAELYPGFLESSDIQEYLRWSLQAIKAKDDERRVNYDCFLNLAVLLPAEARTFLDDRFWEQAMKHIELKLKQGHHWENILGDLAKIKLHRPGLLSSINWKKSALKWDPALAKRIVQEEFDSQDTFRLDRQTYAFPLMPINKIEQVKILVWPEVSVDPKGGRIVFSPLPVVPHLPLPQRAEV